MPIRLRKLHPGPRASRSSNPPQLHLKICPKYGASSADLHPQPVISSSRESRLAAALALAAILLSINPSAALADHYQGGRGAVFVQTNDINENAILAYARSADGGLTLVGRYPTSGVGGTEPGAPTDALSSQGSLTYDRDHHLLYAVNAGSDSVSVFDVRQTRLRLLQVIGSGGQFPSSVAVHHDLVYVMNAGGDGEVVRVLVEI